MRRTYKYISVLVTLVIMLCGLGLIFGSKKTFSENENRYLEKWPAFSFSDLTSGKYTTKVSTYLADHFPLRDIFMNVKTNTQKLLGEILINNVYLGSDNYLIEKYEKGINTDKIVDVLNDFYDKINYTNMELLLVPTSISINSSKLPYYVPLVSQKEVIGDYYRGTKLNTINVYDALVEGNKSYQMFYKLDHHWTTYGAYYAYLEYCKTNNIDPIPIRNFEIKEVANDFKGTLYSKTSDYNRTPDKIYAFIPEKHDYSVSYIASNRVTDTLYEESHLSKKDKYSYFLDNNHPLIVIANNDVHNDKELLVIKDSFANSLIPFLVNHFSKVHVIDPRYYTLSISDYVKENKNVMDVLIVYNMNTIDSDLGIVSIN